MQTDGDEYRLTLHRGDIHQPHLVVCSDARTTRVQVFVDQDVAMQAGIPAEIRSPVQYPLDQLLMISHLAFHGGAIVHSAAAVVGGQALVFPGVSGAGKSTLARLFSERGWRDALLSDDRIVLRLPPKDENSSMRAEAWGTPWPGDAHVARNDSAPLAALLFLVQAETTKMVSLSPGRAMRRLMPTVSCPWYDRMRGDLVLDTCASIVETVPCYDLHFRPDIEVVDLLTGGRWA